MMPTTERCNRCLDLPIGGRSKIFVRTAFLCLNPFQTPRCLAVLRAGSTILERDVSVFGASHQRQATPLVDRSWRIDPRLRIKLGDFNVESKKDVARTDSGDIVRAAAACGWPCRAYARAR